MAIARMTGLASAALLALATTAAAAADIPGNASTKAVLKTGAPGAEGTFEKKADSDWYRIALKGGQNYLVHAGLTGFPCDNQRAMTVNLRDLKGKVLATAKSNGGSDGGVDFRPAKSATYFVEFRDTTRAGCSESPYPASYDGDVTADARGDITTDATIKVGQTLHPFFTSSTDADVFRTVLKAGKGYTVTFGKSDSVEIQFRLLDAKGKDLDGLTYEGDAVRFKAPRSGTYFLYAHVTSEDGIDASGGGLPYSIRLTSP